MNKYKKNKILLISLIVLLIVSLTACKGKEEPEYGYLPAFMTVPGEILLGWGGYATAEEGIYTADYNSGLIKEYVFGTEETSKLFSLSNGESALGIGIGGNSADRRLLLPVKCYAKYEDGMIDYNTYSCFLRCYTVDGDLCWESGIEEDLSDSTNCKLFMAEDGWTYMSTDTCFYGFSAEGEEFCKLEYQGESRKGVLTNDVFACDEKGGIYLIKLTKGADGIDDQQYTIYYLENTGTLKEQARVIGKNPVQLMEGNGFYFKDYTNVYQYDVQTEEMTPVFSLTENMIDSNNVGRIMKTENGWIIGGNDMAATDVQIVTLEWGLLSDKESLTLAAVNTVLYNQQIIAFNQQHPEFRLTMQKYERKNAPGEADQIQLSLLSKDAPDLVEIYNGETYLNYARKGYLLDLTSYAEKSAYINLEDYVPSVREAMQLENKIYGLPDRFYISTLAVPESAVGNRTNWTIEEYLDFMEKNPNAYYEQIGEEMSLPDQAERKRLILGIALTRGMEGFVDAQAGKVDLDNERFRSILTRINALKIDENAGLHDGDLERRIQDGEILMRLTTLSEVTAINQLEREHKQPMVLIGYPTAETEDGGGVLYVSAPLGISSRSDHKDAAWLFLEETAVQDGDAGNGYFPADKEKLEQLIHTAQRVRNSDFESAFDEKGKTGNDTLPDRHADMIWNAIDSAEATDPVMRQLRLIVLEEASYYFAGEKSMDEVIGLMQSRAELYLRENQ